MGDTIASSFDCMLGVGNRSPGVGLDSNGVEDVEGAVELEPPSIDVRS